MDLLYRIVGPVCLLLHFTDNAFHLDINVPQIVERLCRLLTGLLHGSCVVIQQFYLCRRLRNILTHNAHMFRCILGILCLFGGILHNLVDCHAHMIHGSVCLICRSTEQFGRIEQTFGIL